MPIKAYHLPSSIYECIVIHDRFSFFAKHFCLHHIEARLSYGRCLVAASVFLEVRVAQNALSALPGP